MRSRSYSARPISTAAAVLTVPARPTKVAASVASGISRITSSRWISTIEMAWLSSSAVGGSPWSQASVMRTQPMSVEIVASDSVVP